MTHKAIIKYFEKQVLIHEKRQKYHLSRIKAYKTKEGKVWDSIKQMIKPKNYRSYYNFLVEQEKLAKSKLKKYRHLLELCSSEKETKNINPVLKKIEDKLEVTRKDIDCLNDVCKNCDKQILRQISFIDQDISDSLAEIWKQQTKNEK